MAFSFKEFSSSEREMAAKSRHSLLEYSTYQPSIVSLDQPLCSTTDYLGFLQFSHPPTTYPVDARLKLNVHKPLRRRPGRLFNVSCTFNLRPVSTGQESYRLTYEFHPTNQHYLDQLSATIKLLKLNPFLKVYLNHLQYSQRY